MGKANNKDGAVDISEVQGINGTLTLENIQNLISNVQEKEEYIQESSIGEFF